jgi:hypothetical protein
MPPHISRSPFAVSPAELDSLPDYPDLSRLQYLCTLFSRAKHLQTEANAEAFLGNDSDEPVCGELGDADIVETIRGERVQLLPTEQQPSLVGNAEGATSAPSEERISCRSAYEALSLLNAFFLQRKANDSTLKYVSALEEDYTHIALAELHQQLLNPFIFAFDSPFQPAEDTPPSSLSSSS